MEGGGLHERVRYFITLYRHLEYVRYFLSCFATQRVRYFSMFLVTGGVGGGFGNPTVKDLPWHCDFGPTLPKRDDCGFVADEQYPYSFRPRVGETPTFGTGPQDVDIHNRGML